ncbi:hypothetical protein N9867_00185 [bacterium]|nr:hypothetical protein [bacterium]
MRLRQTIGVLLAASLAGVLPALAKTPTGVFLWFPEQGAVPSSADCDALVRRIRPSREKADALLWGRVPFGSDMEYYLFLDQRRMETTYAAEGDYDTGTVRFGQTRGDETAFELIPDDHPTVTIAGNIVAPAGSSVVKVILRNVPSSNGAADRVTYFCRFEDDTEA